SGPVAGGGGGGPGPRVAGPRARPDGAGRTGPVRPGPAGPGPVRAAPPAERGQVELAWFAADDVLPFLAMIAAFLGRGAGKGARGAWNALSGVPARGRRTARAVARAPRQRGGPDLLSPASAPGLPAPPGPDAEAGTTEPAESAEPGGLVTR
ncbi:hypothetical protein ABT084_25505, partial [Streptomyces sp. NPDC002138]